MHKSKQNKKNIFAMLSADAEHCDGRMATANDKILSEAGLDQIT